MLPEGGFGLYIHWPFCQAKCPYCDFNSHVAANIDQLRWKRAYLSEIERVAEETGPRILSTVFFGGGTPSLMEPDLVGAVLENIRSAWPVANDLEVTLEANPGSVEAGRFRGYREVGVNRVSLGLQALDDQDLRRLGRLHSVAEGLSAFEIARNTFERVSFDLIYARQDQSLSDWTQELDRALSLAADHLSLYQLTIEEGTAFGSRHAAGRLSGLPDEDLAADMFQVTQERTGAAGLPAYEVSNHASPGAEARHNLIYWTGGDYAGIGPGAHGRLTLDGRRLSTETALSPAAWLDRVEGIGTGETKRLQLSDEDVLSEIVMMGLRLTRGLRLDRLDPFGSVKDLDCKISALARDGLVQVENGLLCTTERGRLLLNSVVASLLS